MIAAREPDPKNVPPRDFFLLTPEEMAAELERAKLPLSERVKTPAANAWSEGR